jgi:hypothetical protein
MAGVAFASSWANRANAEEWRTMNWLKIGVMMGIWSHNSINYCTYQKKFRTHPLDEQLANAIHSNATWDLRPKGLFNLIAQPICKNSKLFNIPKYYPYIVLRHGWLIIRG